MRVCADRYKPPGAKAFEPFGLDPETGEDLGLPQLSKELGEAMGEVEGGTSRFGALATVLNQKLAPRWKMFTPVPTPRSVSNPRLATQRLQPPTKP